MFRHSWPRNRCVLATRQLPANKKTMSLAISSPTHGLMTAMEMWRKTLRYTPPTTRERQTRSALFRVT